MLWAFSFRDKKGWKSGSASDYVSPAGIYFLSSFSSFTSEADIASSDEAET